VHRMGLTLAIGAISVTQSTYNLNRACEELTCLGYCGQRKAPVKGLKVRGEGNPLPCADSTGQYPD